MRKICYWKIIFIFVQVQAADSENLQKDKSVLEEERVSLKLKEYQRKAAN